MENQMFCFQCEETCRNTGCTVNGMCGKPAAVSVRMDQLLCALKILALTRKSSRETGLFVVQSLFMTITNANFDPARLDAQLARAREWIGQTTVTAPLGVLSEPDENVRSLRELLTYGVKGIAAYTEHAAMLGKFDDAIFEFFFKALKLTAKTRSIPELTSLVLECGHMAVRAMALLDAANTAAFGDPQITRVRTGVGQRPGILVSGHDLRDLAELLAQSQNAGVDVYTHGEMLPAHAYPKLRKYPHLVGNYGNAWHRQNYDFASFQGPVLMTSNCIIPVIDTYRTRIFTTGMAGYPGVPHIPDRVNGQPKDFSAIIRLAQRCPPPVSLGDGELVIGYARARLLELSDKIAELVKTGRIRQFVLMGGCDGRHVAREHYTRAAADLPPDAVILTAGCAKYRYHHLKLGEIDGVPRLLDAGQCNDSYSLVMFLRTLRDKLQLRDVNELPVTFDLAWYEQKAVAVLLALLALGFKNVCIGPAFPAFVAPGIAQVLNEKFGLHGVPAA